MNKALLLRHFTANRRILIFASPMLLLLWLTLHSGTVAALFSGILIALALFSMVNFNEALNENLERFVLSLPVSRRQYVADSFAASLGALFLGLALPLAVLALGHALAPQKVQTLSQDALMVAGVVFSALSVFAFSLLPFRFAFGGKSGLMAFSITFVVAIGVAFGWLGWEGFWSAVSRYGGWFTMNNARMGIGILGVLAFGAGSLWTSTLLFERRDF